MSLESKMQRFKKEAVARLEGKSLADPGGCVQTENYGDSVYFRIEEMNAEILVEELGPLVRPLFEELEEAAEGLSRLRDKLTSAERETQYQITLGRSRVADQMLVNAQQLVRIQEQKAVELRARLVLAEMDEELRKAGFEYPQGIAGLKDAMGFLKRYRANADAFGDLLSRIADIEGRENEDGPGEPIDHKDAMERLDQIRDVIKEFDSHGR